MCLCRKRNYGEPKFQKQWHSDMAGSELEPAHFRHRESAPEKQKQGSLVTLPPPISPVMRIKVTPEFSTTSICFTGSASFPN